MNSIRNTIAMPRIPNNTSGAALRFPVSSRIQNSAAPALAYPVTAKSAGTAISHGYFFQNRKSVDYKHRDKKNRYTPEELVDR